MASYKPVLVNRERGNIKSSSSRTPVAARPGFETLPSTFAKSALARYRVLYKAELAEFTGDFEATDLNKDGLITYDEVHTMLEKNLGKPPTAEQTQQFMNEFDINKDGSITFDEYMTKISGPGWTTEAPPTHEKALTYMVAVDGSRVAKQAFHFAASMMRRHGSTNEELHDKGTNDKLIVYHVTNPGRYPGMASSMHPDVIKGTFETEAISANISYDHEIEFIVEEKADENDKIREKIRSYADMRADVIVLGSLGYKTEEKEDATFESIGKTCATVTSGCRAVTITVHRELTELPKQKQRRWVVAVDGSEMAHCAAEETIKYMRCGDYLQLLYVDSPNQRDMERGLSMNHRHAVAYGALSFGEALIAQYDHWMLEKKVKGAAKFVTQRDGVSIADEILDVAETTDECDEFGSAHVVVIGSTGLSNTPPPRDSEEAYQEYKKEKRATQSKGSVAADILAGARSCAVMCITIDSVMSGAVKSTDYEALFAKKS